LDGWSERPEWNRSMEKTCRGEAKLKCVVIKGPRNMLVTERDFATSPGPGYVPIDVKAVGICGSDIHAFQGTQPLQTYPRVLGHEVSGTVSSASGGFDEGQPVTMEPRLRCGQCYPCRQGRYNCCVELKVVGVHADGAMCERIWAPRHLIHELPDGMPIPHGAMIEPLAIACQVVDRGRIREGDSVLVVGAGPIGLLTLQAAKARGAEVYVSEIDSARLSLAERLGADGTINPREENMRDRVDELTIGEGPNVVIEAAGSPATTEAAIELVSAGGRVVVVGLYGGKIDFEPMVIIRKELDILGSRNSTGKFPVAISLIDQGKVRVSELITHRFPLEMAPEVFGQIDSGKIRPVKALLLPSTP
jgi:L-gulonate 5-dehydrogenase